MKKTSLRRSDPFEILRIEHRNQICLASLYGLYLQVQLHPVELAVAGIRVNANDGPLKPACALPKFRIEVNLYAISYLDGISHDYLKVNGATLAKVFVRKDFASLYQWL